MKLFKFFFYIPLLVLSACCSPCGPHDYRYCVEGAQEFVLDSYKIRQGNFSISELEGEETCCLPGCYLDEYQDLIDEDDVLRIALFHPTRKDLCDAINCVGTTVGYRVVCGKVHIPGLEPVCVAGLTLEQAKVKLQQLYDSQIANTEVFIEYQQRLHSKVILNGAAQVPEVPVNGRIRLYEVLSLAGIPPNANFFKSYVVREGCLLPVNMHKLMHEGDMNQNIVMYPQDKVYIADPIAITILGEVGLATIIPVPNGFLSLREALAAAGKIPFTGDKRAIQVIRGNIVNPKIYKLSWNHITYLSNDSLLLMPGDTVYISETSITKWNRFIKQHLPRLLIDLGIKREEL